jgi:NDP-sugar pyrophosphorylase family protein
MKAILLAGGKGTRLRPLTIHTPKPIVPIFDRPFLNYQLDLLKRVPEIDGVVLSLNYQPRRIEEIFGDGGDTGFAIRYVVEPAPLGTGGAVRYAGESLNESVVVLNGDVLTQVDLGAVIALHRERRAKATIVLTPVENPSAYGLVETDAQGNIQRFLEKPKPHEITCDTINAGIYVLEPDTFDRIPKDTPWSIERSFFPSLIERGETFVAHVDRGYWIDIGTPEKYKQVHRDVMDGRYKLEPFASQPGVRLDFSRRARRGRRHDRRAVFPRRWRRRQGRRTDRSIQCGRPALSYRGACRRRAVDRVGEHADRAGGGRRHAILGRHCHIGRSAALDHGLVLGDKSSVTDYSRL